MRYKSFEILNNHEAKKIAEFVEKRFALTKDFSKGFSFIINKDNKIHILNKDINFLQLNTMRIDSVGMYFGEIYDKEIRFSIEGSEMIGKIATKNILDITKGESAVWMRGHDIETDKPFDNGFLIIRCGKDFLGCGKKSGTRIYNYVPKTRRIKSKD